MQGFDSQLLDLRQHDVRKIATIILNNFQLYYLEILIDIYGMITSQDYEWASVSYTCQKFIESTAYPVKNIVMKTYVLTFNNIFQNVIF